MPMSDSVGNAYINVLPKVDEGAARAAGASAGAQIGEGVTSSATAAMQGGMDNAGQVGAQSLADGFSVAKVALGNIISELATSAASEFKERFSDGIAQSDALQKFASTMEFAGFDTGEIESVRSAMKEYADQTVYDLGEVMATTSKLAANGTADFDTLVQAIGNLNAAAGGDSASFGYLANAITQVNGSGKLMAQDWNQIVNALPGASGAIQDELLAMGAWDESMGTFKDAMADGQISADEFNTAITNLGMTDVAQQAATSTSTFEGAMGQLDASITNTMQGAYDSLNEDGRITDAINSMATAFEKISPYVSTVADAFGDFVEFISPAIPVIAGVVAGIAGFNALMGVPALVTTLTGAFTGLVTVVTTFGGPIAALAAALGGLPVLIAAVVGGIVAFIATNEDAQAVLLSVWEGIKSAVSAAADAIVTYVPQKLGELVTGAQTAFANMQTAVTTTWNNIKIMAVEKAKDMVKGIISSISNVRSRVSSVFQSVKEAIMTPINAAKDAVQKAIDKISSIIRGVKLQLPHINLPHFSVSGGKAPWGIGGKGSLPSFSVSWYAHGGYVDQPTLFGAGERGGELIWPSYAPYLDRYADALASRMGGAGGVNVYLTYNGSGDATELVNTLTRDLRMMRMTGAI